jgi:hypothetical protein
VILGTHIYPATGAAADRMQRALDGWARLSGVRLINLQFADDPSPRVHPAFETRAVLRHDSVSVTGASGPRKPIVRELLDHLIDAAVESGAPYAGFSNADILISTTAISRVRNGGDEAVIFSRMDLDATDAPLGEFLGGQDTFFVRPDAYHRVRRRLRAYVVGEILWDIVYASILLTHVRASLVNRGDDCRHVLHEPVWVNSPFMRYAWRLARQDWTYCARWYRYYYPAKAMRAAGQPAAQEDALRDSVFGPLTAHERMRHAYRSVRHRLFA